MISYPVTCYSALYASSATPFIYLYSFLCVVCVHVYKLACALAEAKEGCWMSCFIPLYLALF